MLETCTYLRCTITNGSQIPTGESPLSAPCHVYSWTFWQCHPDNGEVVVHTQTWTCAIRSDPQM
jgi:hypothetical protein